jgi:hypothetical protein
MGHGFSQHEQITDIGGTRITHRRRREFTMPDPEPDFTA